MEEVEGRGGMLQPSTRLFHPPHHGAAPGRLVRCEKHPEMPAPSHLRPLQLRSLHGELLGHHSPLLLQRVLQRFHLGLLCCRPPPLLVHAQGRDRCHSQAPNQGSPTGEASSILPVPRGHDMRSPAPAAESARSAWPPFLRSPPGVGSAPPPCPSAAATACPGALRRGSSSAVS